MRLEPLRALVMSGCLAAMVGIAGRAEAQITNLISPGPLSKAHASLEGATNCQKCHDVTKGVTAERCLRCHKPVAERIATQKGVHRSAGTTCVKCHAEHGGTNKDLLRIDVRAFDHARETEFPLGGKHARIAIDCVKCHKTRSFLTASPACSSCHADPHLGRLGPTCTTCHPTSAPFKDAKTSFDHEKAAFQLTGAHRTVECVKCHSTRDYRGVKFAACTDCHREPHKSAFGPACAKCHTTQTWKTTKVNHAGTAFPLKSRHETVACNSCHKADTRVAGVRLRFARCADCHADVHKGQFKEDCSSCHNEKGFGRTPFDHRAKTPFPLEQRHAAIACEACHKTAAVRPGVRATEVSFKGLSQSCASCHKDPHEGELSPKCDTCHTISSFRIPSYAHRQPSEFFAGQHGPVACARCHAPQAGRAETRVTDGGWKFAGLTAQCASCHRDVHLGQLGNRCETCHAITAPKFAAPGFSHDKAAFPLTGRHSNLECAKCHRSETGQFPSGSGTAVRMKGTGTTCVTCHQDIHLGQLGNQCDRCHSTAAFKKDSYTHSGKQEFFGGKHAARVCADCHKKQEGTFPAGKGAAVRYVGSGKACSACHTDQHNGALGRSCESCHDPSGWQIVSRAFHKVGLFPLQGKHMDVSCASCHWNGVTKGTPTKCEDCHWARRQDDRYRTALGSQCGNCHTTTSWAMVRWNHTSATGVALNAMHATLGCDSCHKDRALRAGGVACVTCHQADYQRTTSPNHPAAGFPTSCEACHRPSDPSFSGNGAFNHNATFALVGTHATQPCAACHKSNVYKGTPHDCYACHRDDYQRTTSPNHPAAGFPTTCDACHRPTDPSFKGSATFSHDATFALVGVHATQPCAACHRNSVYKGTPRDCYGCHQADFQRTTSPNHPAAGFPTSCEACHRPSDPTFRGGAGFSHNATFALVGVHATQPCAACHRNNVYRGTPRDCYACHQADYQRAQNPNHVSAGLPTTCDACHRPTDPSFAGASFNHSTVFALVGVHATQPCAACHRNNVYRGTPRDCYACHQADYQRAQNPNHVSAGLPTTCDACHRPTDPSFAGASFNHSTVFALVGVHATQPCAACHRNNVYRGTPRDCYGCHQANYQQAQNPNHVSAGFPTTCDACHRPTDPSFAGASFNHSTIFALVGVHATQPCAACHRNNVYRGTPRDCYACHQADYQRAQNPNHVSAGLPTTCDACHRPTDPSFAGASFNHSTVFALVGVHATQPCAACHRNNVYRGTPRDCYGCHQANYQQAQNPNHVSAGFPTTCDACHRPTDPSFAGASFNHSTIFALVGVHATQPCAACHRNNVYRGTPRDCYGCHQANYQQAQNPNHVSAGFPTTCDACHRPTDPSFAGASFNHSTIFALVGVHATQPCAACHRNNVYRGTPRDCYACHQANYQQAQNPNHLGARFATTCDQCHLATDPTWQLGRYNHTAFPITSGRHGGNQCSVCHVDPTNYTIFSCTVCHARATTDSRHNGRAGYRYDSIACYSCHPRGSGG